MNMKTKYVIVTPARDEDAYIENTINAVIQQTILPLKWFIISDGSTDNTDVIVKKYADDSDFIEFIRLDSGKKRDFGSKVKAIQVGYEKLQHLDYDFFGNLDADISFGAYYYEQILNQFNQNPKLGIAGGMIIDVGEDENRKILGSLNSVGCAVQMFRRQCYDTIGGYLPLKIGGEDSVAEAMARMHGWEVWTFPEIKVQHHRRMGTEGGSIYKARFLSGIEAYVIGYHPIFQVVKCLYRIQEQPKFIGSVLRFGGYCWSWCRRLEREVSEDFIKYLRTEQMQRLKSQVLGRKVGLPI